MLETKVARKMTLKWLKNLLAKVKGEANLTLATIAQLYAFMGRRAHIVSA